MRTQLAFGLILISIVVAPTSIATTERSSPRILDSVEIAAVGDLLLHVPVQLSAELSKNEHNHGGYDVVFSHVAEQLRSADLTFANLETPIAPKTGSGSIPFVFNAPTDVLGALEHAGIDVVSFANNHVYDQKRVGFIETLDHIDNSSLVVVGADRTCDGAFNAQLFDVRSFTIAFMATTQYFNATNLNAGEDVACAASLDEERLLAGVARARADGADLIILSIHWGAEYQTQPNAGIVELAHRFIDGGVDVVIGHHPHVLQPVDVIRTADGRDALIAYSLGNFVSNQSYDYAPRVHPASKGNTRDGAILRFRLARIADGNQESLELVGIHATPLWTHNDYLLQLREPGPRFIRVFALEDLVADVRIATGPFRNDETDELVQLYRHRRFEISRILGPDVVR